MFWINMKRHSPLRAHASIKDSMLWHDLRQRICSININIKFTATYNILLKEIFYIKNYYLIFTSYQNFFLF